MNLYDLTAEYKTAAAKLADLDLDEQTLADTLESMSGEVEVKAVNTAMVVRNIESTAAAIKEAEEKMAERRKALERRAAWLKGNILAAMQATGVQKIDSPYFRLCVRENPPAVEVYEPGLVPVEFMRQPEPPPPAIDKAAIKEALKAGREVAGVKLTRGVRLDVR